MRDYAAETSNNLVVGVPVSSVHKQRLLQGLDEIGLVMQFIPQIEAFEARREATA